jgi:hypothetical protein
MAISPYGAGARPRPVDPDAEQRRARIVLLIAAVGIAAILLAYAVSPGVRHAVSHAAHSVKGAVVHVLDRDEGKAKTTNPKKHAAKTVKVHGRASTGARGRHVVAVKPATG